jgi:GcrA cell cycle regulator
LFNLNYSWRGARLERLLRLLTGREYYTRSQLAVALGETDAAIGHVLSKLARLGFRPAFLPPVPVADPSIARMSDAELERRLAPFVSDDWPLARLMALGRSYIQGMKPTPIAERMGCTKNAICGKLHRLIRAGVLDARAPSSALARAAGESAADSAMGRTDRPEGMRVMPAGRVSLPPLRSTVVVSELETRLDSFRIDSLIESAPESRPESHSESLPDSDVEGALRPWPRPAPPARPPQAPRPPVDPPPLAARRGRVTECCWPIGTPGTRQFRFCEADSLLGRPYCEQHASIAFVSVRRRQADPAGELWGPS